MVWWDSSLIWKTNWLPSVLWHCWFGHMTKWPIWPVKIVPDMTYNVFGGTLNLAQSINQSQCAAVSLYQTEMLLAAIWTVHSYCVLLYNGEGSLFHTHNVLERFLPVTNFTLNNLYAIGIMLMPSWDQYTVGHTAPKYTISITNWFKFISNMWINTSPMLANVTCNLPI